MRNWLKNLRTKRQSGVTTTTTVIDADMSLPTTCECGGQAEAWVEYLWRNKRAAGHTTEDVCATHLHALVNNPNCQVISWGDL